MTAKRFHQIKLIFVIVIAMVVSSAIVRNDFFTPFVAVVIGVLLLMRLRRKVVDVIEDERDASTGGKAALLAMRVYAWLAIVIMLVLYGLRADNPLYEPIATTLAYSTCVLMLVYAGVFRYLDWPRR